MTLSSAYTTLDTPIPRKKAHCEFSHKTGYFFLGMDYKEIALSDKGARELHAFLGNVLQAVDGDD